MLKYMITCGTIFTILYVNNMFQIMPNNWVNLFFNIEFFLFVCFFIIEIKKRKKLK